MIFKDFNLNSNIIKAYLKKANGVKKILYYKNVTSTNDVAKNLFKDGYNSNFLIIAKEQTAGRGRGENSFFSPISGIYMTLCIVKNNVPFIDTLTCAAAVAVSSAVEDKCGISPKIKWVNDLYFDGKKICGILSENIFDDKGDSAVIIGIGINLKNTSAFPLGLSDTAGYIQLKSNKNAFIAKIINNLFYYASLSSEKTIFEYKKRSFMLGKKISYKRDGKEFFGEVTDIDDLGRLVTQNDLGETEVFSSGEIKLLSY